MRAGCCRCASCASLASGRPDPASWLPKLRHRLKIHGWDEGNLDPVLPWRQVRPLANEAMRCIQSLHLTAAACAGFRVETPSAAAAGELCRLAAGARVEVMRPGNGVPPVRMGESSMPGRGERGFYAGWQEETKFRRSALLRWAR